MGNHAKQGRLTVGDEFQAGVVQPGDAGCVFLCDKYGMYVIDEANIEGLEVAPLIIPFSIKEPNSFFK